MYDKCNRIGHNGNDELIGQNTILPGSNGYSSSYTSSTYDANGSMTAQYNGSPATNVSFGTFSSTSALVSSNMPTNVLTVTSTGTAGMILSAFGSNNATINAQALLSTSGTTTAILVAGEATDADGNQDFMLAEYDPTTGLPITTFGSGGFVLTTLGNGTSMAANALTVGTSGNIVVAGWANANGTQYVALAEYNSSGSLITTFGSNGIVVTQVGNTAGANAITISGSNVLVAGYGKDSSGNQDILLAEYNSSGTLVSTFGTSGVTLDPVGSQATGNAILVSGSSIYVAGTGGGTQTAVLAQFNSNGTLTRVATHRSGSDNVWNAIGLSGSDIIVSGYDRNAAGKKAIALAEYNSLDSLVTSFGSAGVIMTSVNTSDAAATSIVIEPSGKILVAGFGSYNALNSSNQSNSTLALVVAQYTSNGQPDPTFGVNGVAMEMAVPASATAVQITSGGTIVVAGTMQTSPQDAYVAEFTTTSTAASTYTYDVRNKMIGFSSTTGTASYLYDDAGDRVQETVNGTATFYLIDTNNPTGYDQPIEQKSSPTATPSMTYILGDRVLGQADGSGTLTWLLVDGHGSTRLLTNGSGTVTATLNYDAFGNALNFNPATIGTIWQFGGDGYYDYASSLTFHSNGRQSSSILGRFITMDGQTYVVKTDPITGNLYIVDNADPENGSDPSGHDDNTLADEAFDEAADVQADALSALQIIGDALGGDAASLSGEGSQMGGPDISKQLNGIAQFFMNNRSMIPPLPLGYVDWDITELAVWGSVGNPDINTQTVTVDGDVYYPADVNYFLWGLWGWADGDSIEYLDTAVALHRLTSDPGTGSTTGRIAWTNAGFSYADGGAFCLGNIGPAGMTAGVPYQGSLSFHLGPDALKGTVQPDGSVSASTDYTKQY